MKDAPPWSGGLHFDHMGFGLLHGDSVESDGSPLYEWLADGGALFWQVYFSIKWKLGWGTFASSSDEVECGR